MPKIVTILTFVRKFHQRGNNSIFFFLKKTQRPEFAGATLRSDSSTPESRLRLNLWLAARAAGLQKAF